MHNLINKKVAFENSPQTNQEWISLSEQDRTGQILKLLKQKPEYEFPVRRTIGSFSCYDGSMALLFSKLHSRRLYHFTPPYLFLNSSYKDVSLFIQELVQDTSAFVMEFDCSKNWNTISLYERNEDMKRVFKRAASLYEQTHKPVIIHCYNLEGGLARGEQNLSWNFGF